MSSSRRSGRGPIGFLPIPRLAFSTHFRPGWPTVWSSWLQQAAMAPLVQSRSRFTPISKLSLKVECTVYDHARTLGVGRRTRLIPGWLRRQLWHRDGGCQFPGCGRVERVHAHHRRHWADGGLTDLPNLILLCGYHHRFLHEHGWTIEDSPDGKPVFRRPDGRSTHNHDPASTPGSESWSEVPRAVVPHRANWHNRPMTRPDPEFIAEIAPV